LIGLVFASAFTFARKASLLADFFNGMIIDRE
jgi:hypothetical protein